MTTRRKPEDDRGPAVTLTTGPHTTITIVTTPAPPAVPVPFGHRTSVLWAALAAVAAVAATVVGWLALG
ncbi:hypothetical protein ACIRBX_33690 [Kitasatospora sp. NPDC096147]|uniref:hypothetical protein n=1 Tax=Kitasatospora sp. NPDC096147 TaxID=3364093 RepID=UPI00382CE4B8